MSGSAAGGGSRSSTTRCAPYPGYAQDNSTRPGVSAHRLTAPEASAATGNWTGERAASSPYKGSGQGVSVPGT